MLSFLRTRAGSQRYRLMKKLFILVTAFILAAGLIAGCSGEPQIAPVETINTGVGQEFSITRGFDMHSGYMWREEHNESLLEVVDTAVDTTETEAGRITLLQVFRFKALKKGKTTIILTHARQTLKGPIIARQDVISVSIK